MILLLVFLLFAEDPFSIDAKSVSYNGQDQVLVAQSVVMSLGDGTVICGKKATLNSLRGNGVLRGDVTYDGDPLKFTCQELEFDWEEGRRLSNAVAKGTVTIDVPGQLRAELTRLEIVFDDDGIAELKSVGPAKIDHQLQKIQTSSDLTVNLRSGIVNVANPKIEDHFGIIRADHAEMEFSWHHKEFTPSELILRGHLSVRSKHYVALADKLVYDLKKRQMVLSPALGQSVLVKEALHGVEMSAPALTLKLGENGEPEFFTEGRVRLKLTQVEINLLKGL